MNEDNVVLVTIKLDEGQTEARVKAVSAQLKFLTSAAKGLDKDFNDGVISQRQYDEAMGRINEQSKKLTAELTYQKKALDDLQKGIVAGSGSLNEIRAKADAAKAEFFKLTDAERENEKVGGALAKRIQDLNKQYDDGSKKLTNSRKSVTDYIRDINVLGVNVGQAADSFKEGVSGVGTFAKAIFSARGALIAFTAIPIVLFLTALVAFFKSTDEGADKLEQGIAALTAGFDAILKTIAPLGKALVDAFTHPLEAVKSFGNALLHPLDTIGRILTGSFELAKNSARNFATAANAAVDYTKTLQNIEDAENALIAQREKVGLQVDDALLKVKDRNLTERQRIKILQDAGKEEAKLAQQDLKNATDRYNAEVTRNAAAAAQGRTLGDAEVKRALEAEAAMIKAKRESNNVQQTITNRISLLREQETADAKAAADKQKEIAKKAAQDRVYLAQIALIQAKKNGEDTLTIEEEIIRREAEVQKIGLAKNSAQRKLIDAQTNALILRGRIEHVAKLQQVALDAEASLVTAAQAVALRGSKEAEQADVDAINIRTRKQLVELEKQHKAKLISEDDYNKQLAAITNVSMRDISDKRQEYERRRIATTAELGKLEIDTALKTSADALAIRRNKTDEEINIEEKKQLDLLALEEIDVTERDKREANIKATATAARKENYRQIQLDRVADRKSDNEARLADAKAGSKEELRARIEQIHIQRDEELLQTDLTEKQKRAIRRKAARAERDLTESDFKESFNKIVTIASQVTAQLSALYDQTAQQLTAQLEKQQTAALSSAGTNAQLRTEIEEEYAEKRIELEKKVAKEKGRLAQITAIINTARGVTEAIGLGPFAVALAIAEGIIQQLIISKQMNQYADGGVPGVTGNYFATYSSDRRGNYIGAGPGTTRSDSIPARISVGESVINAAATAKHYTLLSAINESTGGRRFPGANYAGPLLSEIPKFQSGIIGIQPDQSTIIRAMIDRMNTIIPVLVVDNLNQVQADQTMVKTHTAY